MVPVKGFFKNPVVKFLSSLKLSAGLLAIVAIASAKATFVESDYGRDAAYDLIYAARWFEVLLGLVILSLTLLFFKRWPYKPKNYGFMLVHLSIVVILISAGITRYMGYEGVMPIREGQSSDYYYSDKSHLQAVLGEEMDSFPVRLWKYGENNVWGNVELGGVKYKLGVTEYWPRYEESYQPGPGGVPALQYGDSHNGEIITHTLIQGGKGHIGPTEATYLEGSFSETMSVSQYGDLRVHFNGTSCTVPVNPSSDEARECGGYKFLITEFQTDFKVGGSTSLDGPLNNPMIRVEITGPDGATGERVLFALHPDFSMGHGGGEDEFAELDLLYQINRGIEFATGGSTGLQGRATFDLQTMDMNTQDETDIAAGTIFDVQEEVLYASSELDLSFVPVGIFESAVLTPGLSQNENASPAARMVIRDGAGNEASVIVQQHARPLDVTLNGQIFGLAYAPVFEKLPYTLHLDDFVLQTYPGSQNPATYESWVTLIDPGKGIEGEKVHIFMNSPLDHRGTKHFQSSYDPDLKGTVLTVNNDPGKLPTYFGYTLISLGFLLIMLKDLIFPSKSKKKSGSKAPGAAALALLVTLGAASGALAQGHDPNDGSDHSGHNHAQPSGFVELSTPTRDAAARLTIQDYRGRMKPFDTLAREMVMKIAKRSKFEGRHPVDQYLSWTLNPYFWLDKPIIGVRYPGLKDLLGVDHSIKHVSYNSLITPDGQYRLSAQVSEAHRTPDRDRTKTQRKLISFDERFQLLNMTFRGYNLKMYPIPGDENNTWVAYEEVSSKLAPEQQEAYRAAFASLSQGVESGNNAMIMDGLTRTKGLQEQFGAAVLPSKMTTDAELFYNKSHIFSWMMVPLLGTFCVLMPVFLWNLFRNRNGRISFRNPFYSLGVGIYGLAIGGMILGYIMRWIASERIPISNGHESLLFISISVALAGFIFEFVYRQGFTGALGGLLTTIVLGVSMLSTFDPAIGPLVPVLVSYWLNIHVTIITSSYGFLGLGALIGALTLFLLLAKGPGKDDLKEAITTLDKANKHVLITGLGLLTVGTLLGGVWANESWGRYWGWDAKETWSLITILVYALVLHFRWIPQLRSIWLNASGALAAIASVVMTYFGVNYFLTGLHSYAQGDAAQVPDWVFIGTGLILALVIVAGLVSRSKSWERA
jgi:cytochrome c-type biogenesis protein CcsB